MRNMRQKQFYEGPRDRRHIRNPESLNSGMLVGKDPTPSTGIRTPLPIGSGWGHNTYEHSGIQEFRSEHGNRSTSTRVTKGQEGGCLRLFAGSVGP